MAANIFPFPRLGGQLVYVERNLTEEWFQTLKMHVHCFHNS